VSVSKVIESHELLVIHMKRSDSWRIADVDARDPLEIQSHHLRCPDVTDEEWAHIAPLIPPAKRGGRKARNGYARGIQRHQVCAEHRQPMALSPREFSASRHGLSIFEAWSWYGVLDRLHEARYEKCRAQAERAASPIAASSTARA